MGTLYVPIQTRSKKSKSFFASCQKKNIIFSFLGTLSETSSRTFFSRILILHEKKRRKKLCEIRYDEGKKNPTLSYVINMFLLASSDFFESLFPMALCVIL